MTKDEADQLSVALDALRGTVTNTVVPKITELTNELAQLSPGDPRSAAIIAEVGEINASLIAAVPPNPEPSPAPAPAA